MTDKNYRLSRHATPHRGDIKTVAVLTDQVFATGSRDKSAILHPNNETTQHSAFVNSSCFHQGTLYSAGSSKSILPSILHAHSDNICHLSSYNNYLLSSSWDCSIKLWKDLVLVRSFTGHKAAVWSSICLDENRLISASADRTIKVY